MQKKIEVKTSYGILSAEADSDSGISIYLKFPEGTKQLVSYVGGETFEDLRIESYCNVVEGPANITEYATGDDIT